MQPNISNFLANQKMQVLNLFFEKLIDSKLAEHQEIIQRISSVLVTDKDLNQLANLCNEIYQNGYIKCFEHYKEKLKDSGIDVKIN